MHHLACADANGGARAAEAAILIDAANVHLSSVHVALDVSLRRSGMLLRSLCVLLFGDQMSSARVRSLNVRMPPFTLSQRLGRAQPLHPSQQLGGKRPAPGVAGSPTPAGSSDAASIASGASTLASVSMSPVGLRRTIKWHYAGHGLRELCRALAPAVLRWWKFLFYCLATAVAPMLAAAAVSIWAHA